MTKNYAAEAKAIQDKWLKENKHKLKKRLPEWETDARFVSGGGANGTGKKR